MNLAERIYTRTERFPKYDTIGNPSIDPSLADAVVAFDFGDGGLNPDGGVYPGAANTAIAEHVGRNFLEARFDTRAGKAVWRPKVQIFAQTLVAKVLMEKYGLKESDMFTVVGKPAEDGSYIDSWTVAVEAKQNTPWARDVDPQLNPNQERRRQQGLPLGRVAVAAVQQHAGRAAWQTQRAFGATAEVFIPARLPKEYADPDSTQEWTRRPFALNLNPNKSWWPREIITRALAFIGGGPVRK